MNLLITGGGGFVGARVAHTLSAPQTSYGTQKLVCEHMLADYTLKGFVDDRAARLMTVTVRPGRPNGAASSFFSGIIREQLGGRLGLNISVGEMLNGLAQVAGPAVRARVRFERDERIAAIVANWPAGAPMPPPR